MKKILKLIMMTAAIVMFTSCNSWQHNVLNTEVTTSKCKCLVSVSYNGTALTASQVEGGKKEISNLVEAEDPKVLKKIKKQLGKMDKGCNSISLVIKTSQSEISMEKDYGDIVIFRMWGCIVIVVLVFFLILIIKII